MHYDATKKQEHNNLKYQIDHLDIIISKWVFKSTYFKHQVLVSPPNYF